MAQLLFEALGSEHCGVLYQDSYYRGLKTITNYDHPDALNFELMAEHLQQLKQGNAVNMPVYDFETHSVTEKTEPLSAKRIILVDGILIFHAEELKDAFDLKVFMECDEALRLERRLARDTQERGRTYECTLEQFNTQVAPLHNQFVEPSKATADRIISETRTLDQLRAAMEDIKAFCEKEYLYLAE